MPEVSSIESALSSYWSTPQSVSVDDVTTCSTSLRGVVKHPNGSFGYITRLSLLPGVNNPILALTLIPA